METFAPPQGPAGWGHPALRTPGGLRLSGFAGHFGRFVGAGFIPPGALRRRRVPGTMQASSPTEVCYNAGPRFLGWPRHSPSSVGADSISARGCLRRRGVRRDGGIPPYGRPEGGGRPGLAPNTEFIRRGGIYPARGTLRGRGVRRDGGIPPYGRPEGGGRPCLARNAKFIRRGGIYPARGTLRRRGVRRDEGIPPYGRPGGLRLSGFAGHVRKVCRGGIYPARGTLRGRGVRRDGGIPPYGRPGGLRLSGFAGHFGRFVGEGHAPPAGPCRTANIHGRAMALPYEPAQMPPPSGWCETQNLFVGADSISARGLAATQGSRDDLRPKSRACGPVGLRNAPAGAVQASSPTGVCCNAGPQLPGWPPHSPPSAGARAPKAKYHKRPAVPYFNRGRQAAHRI